MEQLIYLLVALFFSASSVFFFWLYRQESIDRKSAQSERDLAQSRLYLMDKLLYGNIHDAIKHIIEEPDDNLLEESPVARQLYNRLCNEVITSINLIKIYNDLNSMPAGFKKNRAISYLKDACTSKSPDYMGRLYYHAILGNEPEIRKALKKIIEQLDACIASSIFLDAKNRLKNYLQDDFDTIAESTEWKHLLDDIKELEELSK